MIPLIITTLTSLIAGVLIGGCARPDDQVTKSLMHRNAQLDKRPITLVATDGRRLTACNSMVLPVEKGLIVPPRKFLTWSGLEGDVAIGVRVFSEVTWFGLHVGPWTYSTRTTDGTYPNWRQVVPPEPGENRVAFTEEDAQALRKILPGFPGHDQHDQGIAFCPGPDGRRVPRHAGPLPGAYPEPFRPGWRVRGRDLPSDSMSTMK